jgi:hypothetical protein
VRGKYNHLACLLDAQTGAGAWTDTESTMTHILTFVGAVGSKRTARTVLDSIDRITADPRATRGAREIAHDLRDELAHAGYPVDELA